MSQLLVRNLEPALVRRLKRRASEQGVSVEEAHRRLLRESLAGEIAESATTFADFLTEIPKGDGEVFERAKDLPREVEF